MTCANHPDRPATVFCQSCGKALCPQCARAYAGQVICEPCLVLRDPAAASQQQVPPAGASGATGWQQVPYAAGPAAGNPAGWSQAGGIPPNYASPNYASPNYASPNYASPNYVPPVYGGSASPVIAGLLGFIPGVGAMYNGQFIKALLHVVIFIVLIGMTSHFGLAGLLIPAWVIYQVFDAAQTAAARRDGRPLPDPFGILDLSQRLGPQAGQPVWAAPPYTAPPAGTAPGAAPGVATDPGLGSAYATESGATPGTTPGATPWTTPGTAAGFVSAVPPEYAPPSSAWQSGMPQGMPGQQNFTQVPANAQGYPVAARRSEPVGAIVLIVVGLLFLLSTVGWLRVDWIYHGWPVLLLLLGVWLLLRRLRTPVVGPVPQPPMTTAPAPQPSGSLSIAPWRGNQPPASTNDGPTNDGEEGR